MNIGAITVKITAKKSIHTIVHLNASPRNSYFLKP